MSIEVTCPNGHNMRVKSAFAGKSGLCPYCHARVTVPLAASLKPAGSTSDSVSEDDLLAVLGHPSPLPQAAFVDEVAAPRRDVAFSQSDADKALPRAPHFSPPQNDTAKKAAQRPAGAAMVYRRRVCPKCCEIVDFACSTCPHCYASLSGWSFPLPAEPSEKEGRKTMCHYLGIRKQGNVLVVRFGEHHILDEASVKKFGDELFQVADRDDCQNVLLNFTGVTGLSSAMLGVMLMLRKKITQKNGQLRLCFVGREILDIFHATRLGQIFHILGTEQQALKTFE